MVSAVADHGRRRPKIAAKNKKVFRALLALKTSSSRALHRAQSFVDGAGILFK
jgi:hypothetical protein